MSTILVTGANRGIGFEFCKQYLEKKNKVFACVRNTNTAKDLISLKTCYDDNLSVLSLDLESENNIRNLKCELGDEPIDILINNAGIYSFNMETDHTDGAAWQKIFQTNSIAPYLITHALLNNIELGKQKKIINISSNMGSISLNHDGMNIPYRASKAALNAITKSSAITNMSRKITIIAMHPGWVRTDMGGINGLLSTKESVEAMIAQIDKINLEDSGKYFSYDGKELTW